MVKLIGYINVDRRKTGFSIPVFIGSDKKYVIQEDSNFIEPADNYLKKENGCFFKFNNVEKIDLNPTTNQLSLFVYDGGKKSIKIWRNEKYSLSKIPKDELTKNELSELNTVLYDAEIDTNFSKFISFINSYKFVQKIQLDEFLIGLPRLNSLQSFFHDIDAFTLWNENKEFFNESSSNKTTQKNILILSYFLRHQALSSSQIHVLFLGIFNKPNRFSMSPVIMMQLYFMLIKNSNITFTLKLLLFDLIENKRSNLIVLKVFKSFEELTRIGVVRAKYNSAFLFSCIKSLAGKNCLKKYSEREIVKSNLNFLCETLSKDFYDKEIKIIREEVLCYFSIDIEDLYNVYLTSSISRNRRHVQKAIV